MSRIISMVVMGCATRCLRCAPTTLWLGSAQAGSRYSMPRSCSNAAAASVAQSRSFMPLLAPRKTATAIICRLWRNSSGRCSRITVSLQAIGPGSGSEPSGANKLADEPIASANMRVSGSSSASACPAASSRGTVTGLPMDRWWSMGSRSLCCTNLAYKRLSMRAPLSTNLTPVSVKIAAPATTECWSAMSVNARR